MRLDPDPGVGDLELDPRMVLGLRSQPDVDQDLPLVGEFQRVADQICQHLLEPQRVSQQGRGHITVHREQEVQAPLLSVLAYQVDLPLHEGSYKWSGGKSVSIFDSTVVRVETDSGLVGHGEVCPLGPFYLPAYAGGVRAGITELAPHLIGYDPRELELLNRRMDAALKAAEVRLVKSFEPPTETNYAGAYLTEILRAGVISVRVSEMEAATALGMSRLQLLRYVILPHIAKTIYAPLSNFFIWLVLGSSLAALFGVEELTGRAINVSTASLRSIETFTVVAMIYIVLTVLASGSLALVGRLAFRVKAKVF